MDDRAPRPPDARLVSRVDQTAPGLWSVTFSTPFAHAAVMIALPGCPPHLGWLERRPAGEHLAADTQVRVVREQIAGAWLVRARFAPKTLELVFETDLQTCVLRIDASGLRVLDGTGDNGLPPVQLPRSPDELVDATFEEFHRAALLRYEQDAARRTLGSAETRLRRRIKAIDADEVRAGKTEVRAAKARWFVAAAAKAPRGATAIEAMDYSTGEAVPIAFALDPQRPAREQLDSLFREARRLRGGELVRELRRTSARGALAEIERALEQIASTQEVSRVRELLQSAIATFPAGVRAGQPRPVPRSLDRTTEQRPWRPYARRYRTADRATLLVGRDAASNDTLTTKFARPHDVFLHVRGRTGAHVILVMDKGKQPSSEHLVDGGTLAAWFSDARGDQTVEIAWAERRYVRKPKGSPVGTVTMDREKVMVLRFERARLERLLASCA